jgi:hypothetical protein
MADDSTPQDRSSKDNTRDDQGGMSTETREDETGQSTDRTSDEEMR